MSAFPEDWQSTEPSAQVGVPRPRKARPVTDHPSTGPTPPASSVPGPGTGPAGGSPGPSMPAPVPTDPAPGSVVPAWALPQTVLDAITDGGAAVVAEGDTSVLVVRMSGIPLLRIEPRGRPAAAWCSESFGRSLAGLFQVERWTKALAANQQADLLLHRGLRAELEVKPILFGLGRGGFRATQGGGIRVTDYHLSHPALGDVATLHVGRNALHVSDVTWPSPRLKTMLRTLISIEAAARKG